MEIVEDSFEGVDVDKDTNKNEVKSKKLDKSIDRGSEIVIARKGFPTIDLNKILEEHSHYYASEDYYKFRSSIEANRRIVARGLTRIVNQDWRSTSSCASHEVMGVGLFLQDVTTLMHLRQSHLN
ncbi:hypothetical protein JHK87_018623 [Glycine soja]|nr:hypothetical protein JHK87_018623 [Glycine soja]